MKKFLIVLIIIIVAYSVFIYFRNNKDTSNHQINSLYKSDERIYNNYLKENEKRVYDLLIENSIKHQDKIIIDLEEYDCKDQSACSNVLRRAHEALTIDHPELMNYAGYSWKYDINGFNIKLQFAYNLSYKDYYGDYRINKILDKMEEDTKDMSDKEKILYVYDWMGENEQYDYYFTFNSKNQSIYNVFIKKNAVCSGFAKASQIIFQRIGINSYIVSGQSEDYHMWNVVEYEGKYYYFDSTVAVGYKKSSEHYYDGVKQETMYGYSITNYQWYPDIEQTNMFNE